MKESSTTKLFPFFLEENRPEREVLEILWPLFERGHSSQSRYFYLRPFFARERFRGKERRVLFPFWWYIRERREAGDRSIDHLWPIYGIHRERIDLVQVTTRHALFPLAYLRTGEGKWKVRLLPVVFISSGFLDRGVCLIPILKAGAGKGGWAGGNRFFYILDPLFSYQRLSIAPSPEEESPEDVRTEIKFLGGLLGWRRYGLETSLFLFWLRIEI